MSHLSPNECAAVQLQEPVNGCGIDCACPFNKRQEGLRALRLYHYDAMTRLNGYAVDLEASAAKHYRKRARYHLGHVQFLNEFFEIGDTAEQDAAK